MSIPITKEQMVELLKNATFGVNKQTLKSWIVPEAIEEIAEYIVSNLNKN